MRFAHIGDVHFRPLARHEEYREAFESFFKKIVEHNVEAVVIAGDIIHEKILRITPEIIDVLVWWFTSMADICPVHVTLGNHDGNLTNENRQDAISPIIKAIDHPNIHLYKESGVYPLTNQMDLFNNDHEINLCVFSCFDEKGWEKVEPNGGINIALFHGSVEGSMTDLGYMLDAEVKVDFFDGYDYAFLGDIHKQQFLTDDKRIAYCGSTLQQDFGESVNRHGFLLWDIRGKDDFDVSLIELENKRPYVTVPWQGSALKTIKEACKWPDESRFRIESKKPLKEADIARINNDLQEKKRTNYIVYKCDKAETGTVDIQKVRHDFRNAKTVLKLLGDFFDDETFTSDEWEEVEEILAKYVDVLSSVTARNMQWTLKRLEFSNLFGYAEDNVIDFESMNGLTGIFGPNRIGKSSLVAAIMFALFGQPDREVGQSKSQYLINIRKTQCKTQIWFNLAGEEYTILRTVVRAKRSNKVGITNKVFFQKLVDGEWINQVGQRPSDTDKMIREKIGTVEDFQLTAIAAQRDMERFISERSTKRKDIVSRFRDLIALDEMHAFAHDDLKEAKGEMSALSAQNWDQIIQSLNDERTQLDAIIADAVRDQESLREEQASLAAELEKADHGDVVTPTDVRLQEQALTMLEEKLSKLYKIRNEREDYKAALEAKLEDLANEKQAIPVETHRSQIKNHHELDKVLSKLKMNLEQDRTLLEQKQRTVDKLKTVPCGDQYPTCKYIRDAHEEKSKIGDQIDFIADLEEKVDDGQVNLDGIDIDKAEVELARYDEVVKQESEVMRKISTIDMRNTDDSIGKIKRTIKDTEETIRDLKSRVVEEDDDMDVIDGLKLSISICKANIETLDKQRMQSAGRLGQIELEIQRLQEDRVKYEAASAKHYVYERLAFAFSKRGIPSQIIKSELPSVNTEIRNILRGVVDFTIELEVDDESEKLEVYINYGDSRRPIEVCSGMERAVASMAIRVALLSVSSISKTNILILDEAFNSLDPKNVDAAARMFSSLKRWFKTVLIISHDESIKNIADNQMEIEKKGKDAYIYYA